jgi:hypothetical protein
VYLIYFATWLLRVILSLLERIDGGRYLSLGLKELMVLQVIWTLLLTLNVALVCVHIDGCGCAGILIGQSVSGSYRKQIGGDNVDEIGREKVRRAMVKLGIALDPRQQAVDVNRARRVLDELERELGQASDSVSLLSLSSQTVDYLEKAGVETVEQLRGLSDLDLLAIDRMGPGRVHEVRSALVVWDEK